MNNTLCATIEAGKKAGKRSFCWLIDPDKYLEEDLYRNLKMANEGNVDFIFLGGSLLMTDRVESCIQFIKAYSSIPVILFPGSSLQYNDKADGMLFLSLISGRNPDLLIGRHVEIAPILKKSSLEVLPTGYMLIDGGKTTTASYISNTFPIPYHKTEIAVSTAIAGELMGLRFIYMDCGSGADQAIPTEMIEAVSKNIDVPLIVGGGIRSKDGMNQAYESGADLVVVGNAIEKDHSLLTELVNKEHSWQ